MRNDGVARALLALLAVALLALLALEAGWIRGRAPAGAGRWPTPAHAARYGPLGNRVRFDTAIISERVRFRARLRLEQVGVVEEGRRSDPLRPPRPAGRAA
jgi:hypothetical protein